MALSVTTFAHPYSLFIYLFLSVYLSFHLAEKCRSRYYPFQRCQSIVFQLKLFCFDFLVFFKEMRLKFELLAKTIEARKSVIKCLSQGHRRMAQVDFELNPF